MAIYWRLKKINHGAVAYALQDRIPQLKGTDSEMIADNLRGCKLEFYSKEKLETSIWIRLTLPFALILLALAIIFSPINYIFCGRWGYKAIWFGNWIRALGF